ncbi:hypothetical protein LCGC14_2297960, partial [marine sediment metagenome]
MATFVVFMGEMMIDKQREKEFLFELERLYYNYNLIIDNPDSFQLVDL